MKKKVSHEAALIRHMLIGALMVGGVFQLAIAWLIARNEHSWWIAGLALALAGAAFLARADVKDGSASRSRNASLAALVLSAAGVAAAIAVEMSGPGFNGMGAFVLINLAVFGVAAFALTKSRQ